MIARCKGVDCKSKYQDKTYGKGERVHNTMAKVGDIRCTVCGTVRMIKGTR